MACKITFSLFVLIFVLQSGFGQSQLSVPTEPQGIKFDIDCAAFKADDDKILVEVYYSFPHAQLQFTNKDSSQEATFMLDVEIFTGDSLVEHRNWSSHSVLPLSKPARPEGTLRTLSRFLLASGSYRCECRIKDVNSQLEGRKSLELDISRLSTQHLSMSDIELANAITKDSTANILTKKGYQVIPNPGATYGSESNILYFYSEVYNLSENRDSSYSVGYTILDADRNVYRSFSPQTHRKSGSSAVEIGGINVVSFPPGNYWLKVEIFDPGAETSVSRIKEFSIVHAAAQSPPLANRASPLLSLLYSDYAHKTLAELDEEFYSASYLTGSEEEAVFKLLDLEAKRKFMANFWFRYQDIREIHLQRLRYANVQFGGARKGWQTDRGRTMLKFGQPDKIDKNLSLSGKRGYEIWNYYQKEGGLIFVFVDKSGIGDFELVHSNAKEEISDPEWRRWINEQ